jgi:hypothetical protein
MGRLDLSRFSLGVFPGNHALFWQLPVFLGSSIERGAEQILGVKELNIWVFYLALFCLFSVFVQTVSFHEEGSLALLFSGEITPVLVSLCSEETFIIVGISSSRFC